MSRRRPRSLEGVVKVDDMDLRWSLRSEPRWLYEAGPVGMTLSVEAAEGGHRELILEFPYPGEKPEGFSRHPERTLITDKLIQDAVRQAIEAGWKPYSRGRVFVFPVPG
jgi:hypothetical protein